jgi:YHS domain-containing protein
MYFIIRFLQLILVGVLVYVLYKLLWKGERFLFFKPKWKTRQKRQHNHHPQAALEEMKKDPVCGTYIPENQAVKYKHNSETYYFCSEECKQKFRQLQRNGKT